VGKTRLTTVELPEFGTPDAMPEIPAEVYAARLKRLRERADSRGYDRLVIYADREHSANLAYLTGFDPRFEEAILAVGPDGDPALLVGNESYAMAAAAPVRLRRHLFQDFSLPSQPRDRSRPLAEILSEEGIARAGRIGVVGWKTYASPEMSDAPAFLVDELRRLVAPSGAVENATDMLIDAADGLRVTSEVEQLAYFEWAACQTSQGVRRLVFGLRPGLTEQAAVRLLEWNGTPLSCHLLLTAGPRARFGLLSPSDRRIDRGDPFTTAFGI
jgi:Xaa-Pro aminopeptidase